MASEKMSAIDEQLELFESLPAGVQPLDWSNVAATHPLRPVRLPERLFLGTSSWSFPDWEGLVYLDDYSTKRLAESGLGAYASCPLFRTVSLDKSYYRPLDEIEYRRLADQVPESFRFIVKAPRDLLASSPSRGFDSETLRRDFLQPLLAGMGEKLGVVLLQFSPGRWRESGSVDSFLGALGRLLKKMPPSIPYALEVRDEELLRPGLARAMEGTSGSLCASIHPRLPAPDKQLLAVPPTAGTPLVFRWNLRPSLEYEQARESLRPFNSLKSPDPARRELMAALIARALQAGRTVYATANNKAEGCAPLSLRELLLSINAYLKP